jgi:hypothetical protein
VLVDILALRTLHEEGAPSPGAFSRPVGKATNLRDRSADDVKRDLKLERLDSCIQVSQEKRAGCRILKKGTASRKMASIKQEVTYGFVRCENVLSFSSRVDSALLNFVHGLDIALKLRRELCA